MTDTDGLETLCATPDEALAHIRAGSKSSRSGSRASTPPTTSWLPRCWPKIGRIHDEIPPGGMDVPLFEDTTTGKQHG